MRIAKATLTLVALTLILGVCSAALAQEKTPPPGAKPAAMSMTPVKPGESTPVIPPSEPGKPATPPAAPMDPEKAPKCVASQTEFDAGVITKGETIKHDFVVENQGKGTLEITRVQPACGCTLSEYDKSIEPGKKGKITLSVTTTNFRGPITKSTSVATNDPQMASFQLIIKADIKEIISIQPSENMQIGLIYKGQKVEKEFTLKSTDDKSFTVSQVESTDNSVKYDLRMGVRIVQPNEIAKDMIILDGKNELTVLASEPVKNPEGAVTGYKVQVKDPMAKKTVEKAFKPGDRVEIQDKKAGIFKVIVPEDHVLGPVNARFTLTTDHPKVPTLSLNCFGTIREPLTVYPTEITFSGLSKDFIEKNPADNSLTKPITLAFETAADFEVKSAKCDLAFVKVTQETLEQGKRYSVKVQLQPEGLQVGDFAGIVTIETNKKTVTIPVKGKIF